MKKKDADGQQESRTALLEAATKLFAQSGYDAVSNRKIADEASANQALIAYYFGSKEGLYLGVFENLATTIENQLDTQQAHLSEEIDFLLKQVDKPESSDVQSKSKQIIKSLLHSYVMLLMQPRFKDFAKLITREQLQPSKAFSILWDSMHGKMLKALSQLVAISHGRKRINTDDKLMALTLIGQVVFFRVAGATVSKQMDWPLDLEPKHIKILDARISANVECLLAQNS